MNRDDIIFHLVNEEDWRNRRSGGAYRTPSLDEEGFIHCSSGHQVKKTANRLFRGERKLLLLVIDVSSLAPEIRYVESEGELWPHVHGPINTGAIIDKIQLRPEEDGEFEISFKTES